jgi:DNA/RNA-binding domain of Phe-tRNA-synthetase-like protein
VDINRLQGGITVHFSDGTEIFTDLNTNETEHPTVGEVIFTDDAKTVHARRWCWRQSDQSAAREDTTDVLFTVEAHHANGESDIRAAIADLLALIQQHAGGDAEPAVLGQNRAGI